MRTIHQTAKGHKRNVSTANIPPNGRRLQTECEHREQSTKRNVSIANSPPNGRRPPTVMLALRALHRFIGFHHLPHSLFRSLQQSHFFPVEIQFDDAFDSFFAELHRDTEENIFHSILPIEINTARENPTVKIGR